MRTTQFFLPVLLGLSCASGATSGAATPSTPQAAAVAAPAPSAPATPAGPVTAAAGPPAPAKLPEPEWLPEAAREMLATRMQRHGEELMLLLVTVLTLGHEDSAHLAREVAAEPRIGRPSPGEKDTLNALLPARFFELQDELRERALSVADAADAKDSGRVVRAFGKLTETCVSCHAVYLDAEAALDLPGD